MNVEHKPVDRIDQFKGCILGLATGDALFAPIEFMPRHKVMAQYGGNLTKMVSTKHFKPPLKAGQWTDDTSMMLCILESIIEHDNFDMDDIGKRFVAWGEQSGIGMGGLTRLALKSLKDGYGIFAGRQAAIERMKAGRLPHGNGGIMRCAPVGLATYYHPDKLIHKSIDTCILTHWEPLCWQSCVVFNWAIMLLLKGQKVTRQAIYAMPMALLPEVIEAIELAYHTSWTRGATLPTGGHTLYALTLALWALTHAPNYEHGVIKVGNLGGDTDTNAAVTGALLGCKYGINAIPSRWLKKLYKKDELQKLSQQLYQMVFHLGD